MFESLCVPVTSMQFRASPIPSYLWLILDSSQRSFQRKNKTLHLQTSLSKNDSGHFKGAGLSQSLLRGIQLVLAAFWIFGIRVIHDLECQWGREYLYTALKLVFQNRKAYPRIKTYFPNEIKLRDFFLQDCGSGQKDQGSCAM